MTLPAAELFGRRARILVGTKLLVAGEADSGLRVAFSIERTLKPEPNRASIRVWNLNEISRRALEQMQLVPVQIEAGYQQPSLLFLGNLREAHSVTEGADIVTELTSGDGERSYQQSRASITVPKGTPIRTVVEQLAALLLVPPGNLPALGYQYIGGSAVFTNGMVISGNAAWELTQLLAACGKEWSIQNGLVQVLDRQQALAGQAILLSAETGMIGSPAVTSKGELSAQMLLAPDVAPGRLLVLKGKHATGNFRIEKCIYSGDTHGAEWTIDITAKRLGVG